MPTVGDNDRYTGIWELFHTYARDYCAAVGTTAEPSSAVFSHFKRISKYRVVNVTGMGLKRKAYLRLQGMRPDYIAANCISNEKRESDCELDSRCIGVCIPESAWKNRRDASFQISAARTGAITVTCPFTGERLCSNRSFAPRPWEWQGTVFYLFRSRELFFLMTHDASHCFRRLALYFPARELVLLLTHPGAVSVADRVDHLKGSIVANAGLAFDYVGRDSPTVKTLVISYAHFAHHLWNELSGLERLRSTGVLDSVDRFWVWAEPLGPIEKLFPEIPGEKIERMALDPEKAQFLPNSPSGHEFLFRCGDYVVSEALASRVANVSRALCGEELLKSVCSVRRRCFPLIWIGLRLMNRSWISQDVGIARIIRELAAKFPDLGIVFDGFSFPHRVPAGYTASMEGELAAERRLELAIRQQLPPRVEANSAIGAKLCESFVWSEFIDMYISPAGTMQHKASWIGNRPGIVHSNEQIAKDGDAHATFWAREGGLRPVLITGRNMKAGTAQEGDLRKDTACYAIDWKLLYEEALKIVLSLERQPEKGNNA